MTCCNERHLFIVAGTQQLFVVAVNH